jgi:hypothetical protein
VSEQGDQLGYVYAVQNTGTTHLHDVSISDPSATSVISCPRSTIASGDTLTCTSAHRLSQPELNAGTLTMPAATVTALDPAGQRVAASSTSATVTPREIASLSASQSFSLTRDRNQNGRVEAGDGVVFRMTVVNTGNVTVRDLMVNDSLLARFGLSMTCSPTTLNPGQRTWCVSSTFTVTGAAAVRGELTNWATARGVSTRGTYVSAATTAVTFSVGNSITSTLGNSNALRAVEAKPRTIRKLTLTQYRLSYDDVNGNGAFTAGETFRLGFSATNEGNTTLFGLTIVDERLKSDNVAIICNATTLAPGETTTCTSDPVTITPFQGKVDQGYGTNYAYATAYDAANVFVRSNSTQLYQGYFISDIRTSALADTGSTADELAAAGLALVGVGAFLFLLSRGAGKKLLWRRTGVYRRKPFTAA